MRARLLGVYAVVPLALLFALTGCGKDDPASKVASVSGTANPSASSTGPALSEQERALKFAQCMREHGVDMPDPVTEDGKISIRINAKPGTDIDAAQAACKQYAPDGGPGGGKVDPQMQEQMRKMAQCMRDNGVENFPDPQEGGGIRLDGSISSDPDFEAAQKKCGGQFGGPQVKETAK